MSTVEEPGVVRRLDGDRAEVEITPSGSCAHCGAAGVCNWTCERKKVVLAQNPLGARPGERVLIRRTPKLSARFALLVFGLPALLMVTGVVLGELLLNEIWAVVLSGAGLVFAIGIVRMLDRLHNRSGRVLPVIVQRLAEVRKDGGKDEEAVNFNRDLRGDNLP